jgi:probable HAF family extracellular repeat protein
MSLLRTSRLIPLAVLALAVGAPAATAATHNSSAAYAITDLGSLGSGVSYATGINATGQVTGSSDLSTTIKVTCFYTGHYCLVHPSNAFLYSNGTMTGLGTLGGNDSVGNAINRTGQVAGWSNNTVGVTDAFLWDGKNMIDLGALAPLSGKGSTATGINDSGQVVGYWGTTVSSNPSHAWLYANGTVTSLPEPSFATAADSLGCTTAAINNNGQIVGSCYASGVSHAVLWQNGTVTDLGTLGGSQAAATAINNLGQVVGWAQDSTSTKDGFLWSNGMMTNLGNFLPAAINDNGVMVGGDQIDSGGTLQNLSNLIPSGTPYQIASATAINNNGQIAVDANDTATSQAHALLLTPG